MPVDPGRHWLEAGITGLARQREWDAVATVEGPGTPGDEVEFVSLPDGRLLRESGTPAVDLVPLAEALQGAVEPPYRATAMRRPELWAVGARTLETIVFAEDPGGDAIEVVSDAAGLTARVDGIPSLARLPELEQLGRRRGESYVVRARRLAGELFEVSVEPL